MSWKSIQIGTYMIHTIQNRHGLNMEICVEEHLPQKGLVFILHGLGGFKDQPHITSWAKTFSDEHFTVVRYDGTHSFGASDGGYEDATVTTFMNDLEDVIAWASKQIWYEEPFWLVGHSLGGMAILLYAEEHPQLIRGIAPIASDLSGTISLQSPKYQGNTILADWKRTGWREEVSSDKKRIKRLKWSHMENRLLYDVFPQANKLTMPVLLIVGTDDISTTPDQQQLLFDQIPGEKELYVIPNASHNFPNSQHRSMIEKYMHQWIQKIISLVYDTSYHRWQ